MIKKITQTAVMNIVFQCIFIELDVSYASQHTFSYETSSSIKMQWNTMFITAVCVIFLIKLRWPKNKSLYDIVKVAVDPRPEAIAEWIRRLL